jgi:hypothetical protein
VRGLKAIELLGGGDHDKEMTPEIEEVLFSRYFFSFSLFLFSTFYRARSYSLDP